MAEKPTYEELEKRTQELEKAESDTRQAEDKLKEKEFQYRNLANAGLALIWTSGIDKLCNYFNDPWLKFTGRTLEQEMGNGWTEGVHPDDFDRCLDIYVTAFDKREPFEMEYRLRHASGRYMIILDLGTPNFNSNGEFIGYIGHCFDITDRKQAEEALRETKFRAEQYLNMAAEIIISIDRHANITLLNDSGHKLLGYDPGELIGKNWFTTCLPEDSISEVHEVFNKLMNAELENVVHYENMVKTREGLLRCVFWHNTVLRDADDNVIGLLSSGKDITDRKRSEETLRQSEARLRLALKAAIAGIWEWDIHTNENIWSDELYQLYDLDPKITEASYESWLQSVFPEDRKAIQIAVHDAAGSERELNIEWRVNTTDGSLRWLMSRGQPLRDTDGKVLKYHGIVIDITERKQSRAERDKLQAQLNQTQKMESIGTLAGGIAHDFNNILFPLIGHAEMLLEDIPEDGSIRESLNQIYSSSLRARDLVQQILAFARQEKNELKLMKMQPIITEAMKLIRSTIPASIAIRQNLQPDCRPVSADPTQIHQIVMNLATNAYHAMEESGGELKVNLKEIELGKDDLIDPDMSPGLYACLTIGDTGVGISKDVMNRIFDPFFTTKEKGKGTGMGLSVVHGIVKHMNGEIRVYSEPGKGAEFQVYLPVVGNASEKQASPADEPIPGGCERVLLVDDEETIIAMEKRILDRLGYQVTARPGSVEALEAFRANPDKFDLVITDMSMPKMSGDKLAVELIKIRPDIPILLCTGYSESMTDEKIKSLGTALSRSYSFLFSPGKYFCS